MDDSPSTGDARQGIGAAAKAATARTRQRTVPASKRRLVQPYAAVIELAPDATVVADGHGHIVLVNRQTAAVFGYARKDLLGQSVERLLPERFHQVLRQHCAAFIAAPRTRLKRATLPLSGRRQDGREFPVDIRLAPLHADGETLVIASIRDVSDAQRVQAMAEAATQQLERLQALTDTALAHLELDDLL
jgi:protein-histidine pros-kinase